MSFKKFVLSSAAAAIAVSSVFAANVPVGYSVYSYEELKIGDRAGMNGGIIGCKSNVLIGFDAVVSTDIIANGNVILNDRAKVEGVVTSGGTVTKGAGAVIEGGFTQRASVPVYTIPTKTFSTGTAVKTINFGATGSAAPGNYNKIEVFDRGTLNLSSGTYNCNSFKIGHDVKINFTTGPVILNIKNEFTFQDRSEMILPAGNDGSGIEIYYNGTAAVTIGFNTLAYGVFAAPNAAVTVADRAQFNGSLYAKKVELQPGLYATNLVDKWLTVDSDGDGVPDYVEDACGTDPSSSSGDKPAIINTGTYANKTALGTQSVTMSVSHVPGYSHVADFPITFGKGSVKGDLIPVNNIIATDDYRAPTVPLPLDDGYSIDGNKHHAISGEVQAGKKILFAFPISDTGSGITKDLVKLSHFNEQTDLWENVEIAYVTGNAVYAFVSSFSVYTVTVPEKAIYRVKNLSELGTAFSAINTDRVSNPDKKYYVYLSKGTFTATIGYTIPLNTNLIGGFDFALMSTNLNDPVANDPKKNRTIIDGSGITDPIIRMDNTVPSNSSIGSIIDGIEFYGSRSSDGPVVFSASMGHNTDIHIVNCVFEGSNSPRCGGILLFNVSNVYIESCVFVNNTVTSTHPSGASSAILISQYPQCGVQAKIHSCVFANNQIQSTSTSPSGTICNTGDFEDGDPEFGGKLRTDRPVDIYNCTFYQNSTQNPSGGSVAYRSICEMPMSVQNCVVIDGTTTPIYGGVNAGTGTTPPTNIVTTGTEFNPSTSVFVSTANLVGTDNKWGTGDDGLRLKIGSDLCYKVAKTTKFSSRDVTGRLRKRGEGGVDRGVGDGSTTEWQDLGAYETYVNVLTIGSANTLGTANITTLPNDGWCYQSKLKTKARENGYLLDFVGLTNSAVTYGQNCYSGLGEDPSTPNTIINEIGSTNASISAYDIQMAAGAAAGAGGKISDYATYNSGTTTWTVNSQLVGLNFDYALVNIGDKDVFAGATPQTESVFNDLKGFVTAFAAAAVGKKILLSTPVLDDLPENGGVLTEQLIKPIREADDGDFGNAIFNNGAVNGYMNADTDMLNQVEEKNYIATVDGFEIMATVWWNLMDSFLSSL